MELRHLRYFVQVAEDLHFGRAAARLGMSQPPLSQQIRQLEAKLGVTLLERSSRHVALTPAGTLFLEAARATLDQADRAVTLARRAGRGELGDLVIGFNASAPFVPCVASAIHDFRRTYPAVRLALSEIAAPAQVAALADMSLDVGFVRSSAPPALPQALVATRLIDEPMMVAMRPDHPLAAEGEVPIAALGGEPMVTYDNERGGGFTEDLFALMRAAGAEPCVAQAVFEISTLLGLVAAGVGVTVVAASLSALQPAGLAYRPLRGEGTRTSVWLVHRRNERTLPCRNFLAMIRAAAPDGA